MYTQARVNEPIISFSRDYYFLSNFYPATVTSPEDKMTYPTVEHAYQAAKSNDIRDRLRIAEIGSPKDAKRAGRKLAIRHDWEEVKRIVMFWLVLGKFEQHPELLAKLAATGDAELIEGNTWDDREWGMTYNGLMECWYGKNYLGQILMSVRMLLVG